MPRIDDLLEQARRKLATAPFAPSKREASLLLGHVLGLGEAQILARPERQVTPPQAARFEGLIARRLSGEPVAYLLGKKEFYGRHFFVDPRVLIPRPETEHLIESALALDLGPRPSILDVGTGSGCLAVTLALELPSSRVVATDVSPAALAVASANIERHGVADRVLAVAADLAASLHLSPFDLVVSNPPYVASEEVSRLSPEIREFEPHQALFAADSGHAVLGRILSELAGVRAGTPLLLEIGSGQLAELRRRAARSRFRVLSVRPDYAGVPRVALLERS